jgi:hypothetical protein
MDAFTTASVIWDGVRLWLGAGLATAVCFLAAGLDRVDPAARRSWAFRPLLAPGIVLLWPWVLARWAAIERGR